MLSDLEGDPFTVTFSGTSMAFLSAVFNKQDGTVKAAIDKRSVKLNGFYTLVVKVEETRSNRITSI